MRRPFTLLPLAALLALVALSACSDDDDIDPKDVYHPVAIPPTPVDPSTFMGVTDDKNPAVGAVTKNANDIIKEMTPGINLGNMMECPNGEGDWNGGVKVSRAYIDGIKAAGFKAIRIPCAWNTHLSVDDPHNLSWTIDPAWLQRVDSVVSYITSQGLYAIVNVHWDGGWLEENLGYSSRIRAIKARQESFWKQIAAQLQRYDHHLLFAGMNEPGRDDATKYPALDAQIADINALSQTFVDVVRASGGNNATRTLVVQMPNCNCEYGLKPSFALPSDPAGEGRLMAEFHYYSPYQFCLMEKDDTKVGNGYVFLYWGAENHVAGSRRNSDAAQEAGMIAKHFAAVKTAFVDKGIPCIVGECSSQVVPKDIDVTKKDFVDAADKTNLDAVAYDQAKHEASRALWNKTVFAQAKACGMCAFYWEAGNEIDRKTGSWKPECKYSLDAIIEASK